MAGRKERINYGILALGILASICLIWYIYPLSLPPDQISDKNADPGLLLRTAVPAITSLLLVALYTNMSNIQSQQTDIQDIQKDIQEAQHRPKLNISEVGVTRDSITLTITNAGESVAEDLALAVHLYILTSGKDNQGISVGEPSHQNRLVDTEGGFISSLGPRQTREFSTNVYVPSREFPEMDEGFSAFLKSLESEIDDRNESIERVYLQFEVQYTHQMPEKGPARQFVRPIAGNLTNGYTLEDLVSDDNRGTNEIFSILNRDTTTLRVPQVTYRDTERQT